MTETLLDRLIRHEGIKLMPYVDTMGKTTIGIGRNLTDKGITHDEALYMCENDMHDVQQEVTGALPWILGIDDLRQSVVYEMAFQLGVDGLLGFRNMIAAIKISDWQAAHDAMLDSQWNTQTPSRCQELAGIMLNGSAN